jgi:hypothetical protein
VIHWLDKVPAFCCRPAASAQAVQAPEIAGSASFSSFGHQIRRVGHIAPNNYHFFVARILNLLLSIFQFPNNRA